MKKVVILGSGIVGIMSSYFLSKAGFSVTVLESAEKEGMGCSGQNGCQLSFSHCEPWNSWGSMQSILKSIVKKNSKISLDILKDKNFWLWSKDFISNSKQKKIHNFIVKLTEMGQSSKSIIETIIKEEDIDFEYNKGGILHFYRHKKSFERAVKISSIQKDLGCNIDLLSASDVVAIEPNLLKLLESNNLYGGLMHNDDASGDIKHFMPQIKKICQEKYQVDFKFSHKIQNILTNHKSITGINTDHGVFKADHYISCLGAYGSKLMRGIGIKDKIYPIKGYSLSIPITKNFLAPKNTITDPENKIVYSNIGDKFRAAGTFEISPIDYKINQSNINFLKKTMQSSLINSGDIEKAELWQGYRPSSSEIMPVCQQSDKYKNFYLNSGHGSFGWTMCFASAKKISDIISL